MRTPGARPATLEHVRCNRSLRSIHRAEIQTARIPWQEAWILELEAIIEQRQSYGCASLRVVGMSNRVDECLSKCRRWDAPRFLTSKAVYLCAAHGMLFDERNREVDRLNERIRQFEMIVDLRLVVTTEPGYLDPCVWES